MGQSAGQERPGRMLCAEERLRQAVFSVCSNCAQRHLTPTHSSPLQPKFGFRANLGWSGPERDRIGWRRVTKTVAKPLAERTIQYQRGYVERELSN
jgi:hypothetical protein